jgi:pyruvate formate lyase activating enzyme
MVDSFNIEIKGIIPSSFLDWDGKVVTTVYLPRCNFQCPYCHNWELTDNPEKFKTIAISELDRHIRTNNDFLDGVCITGGEPTIYNDLPKFINHLKDLGLLVKLDTNGTNPDLISDLINNRSIDFIAMDIKGPFDKRYEKIVGIKTNLNKLKRSVEIIMDSNIDYEFRTTVVPTLLNEEDILDIVEYISDAKKYVLQQYVPDHARDIQLREVKGYSTEELLKFSDLVNKKVKHVKLRGLK